MKNISLRVKFLLGILGIVGLLGLSIIGFVKGVLVQHLEDELQERTLFIAKDIAIESTSPILTEKMIELQMLINDHKNLNENIKYIFVLNSEGEVLAHTFKRGFPSSLREANVISRGQKNRVQFLIANKENILDVAVPISGEIGIIRVGISEEPLKNKIAYIVKTIIRIIVVVLILGCGGAIIFATIITKPIRDLTSMARKASKGNFEYRVHVKTKDEVGQLGAVFNLMIENLNKTTVSKEYLDNIIDSMGDILIVVNYQGKIKIINQAVNELLGYRQEEATGRDISFLFPEEGAFFQKDDKGNLEIKEQLNNYEINCKTKDDREISLLLSSRVLKVVNCPHEGPVDDCPAYKEKGNHCEDFLGVVYVMKDNTERKKAEEEIKKQKNFLVNILESLTHPFYVIDVNDYTIKIANSATYSGKLPKGATCYENAHKLSKPCEDKHICPLEQVKKTKKPVRLEHIHYDKNGNSLQVEVFGYPIFDTKGNVVQMIEYTVDITKRKKAEEEIKKQKDFLANILESLTHPFYVIDANDYTIKIANSATYHGKLPEGVTCYNLTHKRSVPCEDKHICPLEQVKKTKQPASVEHIHYDENNNPRYVEVHGYPIFDAKGNVAQMIEYSIDITKRKEAMAMLEEAYRKLKNTQSQLIQANKMVAMGQLAAGISHELNQPLTGIKGFAQVALMELKGNPSLRSDLSKIVAQADRMDKIIKNVRFFAGKSEFKVKALNINRPLKNSLMLLGQQFDDHNIKVNLFLEQNLPRVEGDENQLQQVFLNLATNARDAINASGKVKKRELSVKTCLAGDKKNIEIIFEDSGCGISKKDKEDIFNPFFTTKSPDGGMGLGLAIAYRIVSSHNGKIEVESKENEGSKFKVILPLVNG